MQRTKTLSLTQAQLWQLADALEGAFENHLTEEETLIRERLYERIMNAWHKLNDES